MGTRLECQPTLSGARCAPPPDEELLALLQKRAALEADADELNTTQLMTLDEYRRRCERLMVEPRERRSRDIRRRRRT